MNKYFNCDKKMKAVLKHFLLCAILLLLFPFFLYSQNNDSTENGIIPKGYWSIEGAGGIGFAQAYTQNYNNLNVNSSFSEVLVSYSLNDNLRLKTGIQFIKLNNSSIESGNYTNYESSSIQVPLKLGFVIPSSFLGESKTQLVMDIGFFGNYHIKDKLETNIGRDEEKYLGWHLGYCIDVGMEFKLSDFMACGIYVDSYVSKNINKKDIKFRIDDNRSLKLSIIFSVF